MSRVKKISKIVILTVLTVVVLFYLLPNVTYIEQSLEINTTPDKIFELVNSPEKWTEWYTPLRKDHEVRLHFSGPLNGKGAKLDWTSSYRKMKGGSIYIRNAKNNRNVAAVVDVNDRHSSIMTFKIKPVNRTSSLLTITSRLSFPQDSLLHYLRMVFDRSEELRIIDYIENIGEAAIKKADGIPVHVQRADSFQYISITNRCKWEDLAQNKKDLYQKLLAFVAVSGMKITDRPISVYHRIEDDHIIYEMGIPVEGYAENSSGDILCKTMEATNCVTADHYGSYDTLGDAHNAIMVWLSRFGKETSGNPWEIYVTDPLAEPDSNKWLTRIFYPIN
ncbi:MAG: GyrI-like domain-containing protein [Bacteroidales bacterium]|jgi:effector-binding domain-containing protein|nr:GyrI-like domain-containing protein [Bacteroidales bacterium]